MLDLVETAGLGASDLLRVKIRPGGSRDAIHPSPARFGAVCSDTTGKKILSAPLPPPRSFPFWVRIRVKGDGDVSRVSIISPTRPCEVWHPDPGRPAGGRKMELVICLRRRLDYPQEDSEAGLSGGNLPGIDS